MIRFIEMFAGQFGVEPICAVLGGTECGFLTSRGYRAARARPPSDRAIRDEAVIADLERIHAENYSVYGVRKMHAAMRRAGWEIGRDQTARLMRAAGLVGVSRGRTIRTTTAASQAAGAFPDLVSRRFVADRPCQLWVADITYVPTWSGFAYTAFVTDVFSRKIVGWNVASRLTTELLPLHALEMAAWASDSDLTGLVHHSDRGSQYLSLRYSERLTDLGICGSVGSAGDSYDNALAESIFGLYKTELIKPRKPWRTVEQVELGTLDWVWWFNNIRLHSELGYRTPVEIETAYYAATEPSRLTPASLANH